MVVASRINWKPSWRIIPSRFPPIQLFERVTDAADLEAVIELESMTNPRLRDEVGDIQLVPPDERVSGPGSSIIMAAFTHLNPDGSRFTDGTYGVFYAANDLETAIAETKHHREAFMRATNEPRMELDMRVYLIDVQADYHDIRGRQDELSLVYDLSNYAASQHFSAELRAAGSNGIVYSSVRRDGGECIAAFRTFGLTNVRQERHLCYIWDGAAISMVYEKKVLSA